MSLFYAYKNRGITKDITVLDGNGDVVSVGVNDKLRAIIGRERLLSSDLSTAKLVVVSGTNSANGSSFEIGGGSGGSHRLRLDAGDLDFNPGTYTLFIDLFDNADAGEWKNVDRQVFVLEGTE